MAKFYNTFEFIGDVQTAKDKTKIMSVSQNATKTWETTKVTMGIKKEQTNSVFLDVKAGTRPDGSGIVYAMGVDGTTMKIPFKDRKNPDYLDLVADFSKYVVDLETDEDVKSEYTKLRFQISNIQKKIKDGTATDEDKANVVEYRQKYKALATNRHEFISQLDFVEFIGINMDTLKECRVKVRGNYSPSYSNGKSYLSYEPRSIEVARADEGNKLEVYLGLFFGRDAITIEDNTMFIDGYVLSRDSYAGADRYFRTKLLTRNAAAFDAFKTFLGTKEKTYQQLAVVCEAYNGANQKEFTEDDLTDAQKMAVSLGMATIESFRPAGGFVLGNNISELRLIMPLLKGDFASGAVDTGMKEEEILELIAKGIKEEKTTAEQDKIIAESFGAKAEDKPPFEPDTATTGVTAQDIEDIFGGM
jgi:hypothetical protein